MNIEEQINELIIQMENRKYLFESDGPTGIGFWGPEVDDGNREYRKFKDWDEVEKFVNDNQIED